MSGCHDSKEDVGVCEHLIKYKECDKCKFIEKLHSLENLTNELNYGIGKCFDKVEKLEGNCNSIWIRMDKLEREIQNMGTSLSIRYDKKPHKCPVCNGMGGFLSAKPNECHSCNGKGIVWG